MVDVAVETKTKDNVFVTVVISVQYEAIAEKVGKSNEAVKVSLRRSRTVSRGPFSGRHSVAANGSPDHASLQHEPEHFQSFWLGRGSLIKIAWEPCKNGAKC